MTRRLQILPEVLPAPTRATPNGGVRSRTVAHMQRLLATAAAIPLAGCTRADTQGSQTVTIPVSSATSTATVTDTATHGSLLPPPTATATTAPTVTAPETGYAVVDPMPAPARCMGLASASKTTAAFKRHGADWLLEVTVSLPTSAAWAGTAFSPGATISPWSGQVVSSNVTSHTAKVVLKPTPGSGSLGFTLSISCAAGAGNIAVNTTFSGTPSAGTTVNVTTNDY